MRCTPLQPLGCVGVRSGMQVHGRFFVCSTWICLISCWSEMATVTKSYTSAHAYRVAAWKITVKNFTHVNLTVFIIIWAKRDCILMWEKVHTFRKRLRGTLWLNTEWELSDNMRFSETRSYKLGSSKQRMLLRSDSVQATWLQWCRAPSDPELEPFNSKGS